MTAPMHQSAYLYSGSLYSPTGRIVETPSVLVDPGMDMILTWGEPEYVQREFDRIDSAAPNLAKNLEIIELSGLTKPQACYVIRRMMEFTASGFVTELCRKLSEPDALSWLKAEMSRVPIETPDGFPD